MRRTLDRLLRDGLTPSGFYLVHRVFGDARFPAVAQAAAKHYRTNTLAWWAL